jgi:1-acyl-sn-glycerol-3-phosphate acyltransferase
MLYRITKPLARVGLSIFFRKVYISNRARIPYNKPVILAANHPTAFIEPCVLACWLNQPLHFLVRGDIFKKPLYIKLLNSLHMVPVFRLKDGGYGKLRDNYESFDKVQAALQENKTIMILAEGRTLHEKRLRPLKKGTARLAFGTLEALNGQEDVYIVPVGVNYTYADQFRSEVMIDFGEPIRTSDYLEQYQENPNRAMVQLTDDLRSQLEQRVIVIEQVEDEALAEQLLVMARHQVPDRNLLPVTRTSTKRLELEMRVTRSINTMDEAKKQALKQRSQSFHEQLQGRGLEPDSLLHRAVYRPLNTLVLLLGFVPFALGYALNFSPFWLASYTSKKRVRHIEFKASVEMAVGLVSYTLYALLGLIPVIVGTPYAFWVWLSVPVLGYWALFYRDLRHRWQLGRKAAAVPKAQLQSLRAERDGLLGEV